MERTFHVAERYDVDNGDNALAFVAWLNEQIAKIPFDYRDNARVEFSSYYESYGVTCSVFYTRDETEQEIAKRKNDYQEFVAHNREKREAEEKLMLAALKIKYEGKA